MKSTLWNIACSTPSARIPMASGSAVGITTMIRVLRLSIFLFVALAFSSSSIFAQTRIEQNDPAITYSGNWYTNDGAANTGGHAVLTNAKGARASIAFYGTGIRWKGHPDVLS